MKLLKKNQFLFLLIVLVSHSCSNPSSDKLLIATAANVQFAMKEIIDAFEEKHQIPVAMITGSSGKLTAQIIEGAPFDVFVSADMKYPITLAEKDLAINLPKIYALGKLVHWSMQETLVSDLKNLTSNKVKNIAIANPKNAPYGLAAVQALRYFGLYNQVQDKLVYGESISQTNQFIHSESAQTGFTSKSVVLSPDLLKKGYWVEIPQEAYLPIQQGIILIKNKNKTPQHSTAFHNFLFSAEAQNILTKYGYDIPK